MIVILVADEPSPPEISVFGTVKLTFVLTPETFATDAGVGAEFSVTAAVVPTKAMPPANTERTISPARMTALRCLFVVVMVGCHAPSSGSAATWRVREPDIDVLAGVM